MSNLLKLGISFLLSFFVLVLYVYFIGSGVIIFMALGGCIAFFYLLIFGNND